MRIIFLSCIAPTPARLDFDFGALSKVDIPARGVGDRGAGVGVDRHPGKGDDHLVQAAKKLGGPVESLPLTPVVSRVTPIALGRYAPHPNVGKLFIDFALSEEGQKILRSFGRSSARKGIEPDELQKKGIKLYVSDISLAKDYARYDKEFKEIFNLR